MALKTGRRDRTSCRKTLPEGPISALEIAAYGFPQANASQNGTFLKDVDAFCKPLKLKTFISEKSLDTPVFALIRFRQKVLTEFQSLRWNYSPLKKRPPSCRVAFSFAVHDCESARSGR